MAIVAIFAPMAVDPATAPQLHALPAGDPDVEATVDEQAYASPGLVLAPRSCQKILMAFWILTYQTI